MVLDVFRSFQVAPLFDKYTDVLTKKVQVSRAYPVNSVGRGGLGK